MKLIAGLGNPGEKYVNTRHNFGFMTLDTLLKEIESADKTYWNREPKWKAEVREVAIEKRKILLAKPQTFMNNSGFAIAKVADFYNIKPEEIAIVYDDLDLPMGKIRIRFGGAAGGHHGVESIIKALGTDKFLRIRLGIGKALRTEDEDSRQKTHKVNAEEYVLSNFTPQEKGKVREAIRQAIHSIHLITTHGIETYMSKYHSENQNSKVKNKTENT